MPTYPNQQSVASVSIGGRRVGPGEPVFVVAEAGVNHDGSVGTALRMVDAAAEAGADAVKFQLFRASELATESASTADYQQAGCGDESQQTMLSRLELTQADFRKIKKHCDSRSITFLASAFGCKDVDRLGELGVAAIKIASTDLRSGPLLDAAAKTGLAIIMSTGASRSEEIHSSVNRLLDAGMADRLVLLHCVSCYPTPTEALNLRAIAALQRSFGVPCGLSDHSLSTDTGGWAVAAGACMVEKHFTLDRNAAGPDHGMSLSPEQFCEYVEGVRRAEQALGDGRLGMDEREAEVRLVAGKSVVSAVVIPEGARLGPDMLTLKRPGTGIAPNDLEELFGRRAAVQIPADAVLSWDMIE